MLRLFRNEVNELGVKYAAASEVGYNHMAKVQVELAQRLCEIDSLESIDLLGKLMIRGNNHEYMNFALPNLLETHWATSRHKKAIGEAFIHGMNHGQNEDIQSSCIRKLLKASYTDAYSAILKYQSLLRFNDKERPEYWQSLLLLVDYAERQMCRHRDS